MKNTLLKNKVIFSVGLLALLTFFSACDEEVSDLQPFDRLTETTAFETPERVELSMVGVYDAAQSGFYNNSYGANRGYPFGAANAQQGDMRGEDMLNVALFYAITYEGTYNPTTANNLNMWETLYALINRANIVIQGVQTAGQNGVITEAKAREYEGEARFLRALAHHELLIHFARPWAHTADASHLGVPYRTDPVNTTDALNKGVQQGRNTVRDCYTRLIEDLNFAEQNLPERRGTAAGGLNITRATQGAAIALKTRIYQHQNNWAAVITEAEKLTSKNLYRLTATPDGPFRNNANNTESIFAIENSNADNPQVNGSLSNMYTINPGRALIAVSPILWNAPFWDSTDLRRTQLYTNNGRSFHTTKYPKVATQDDYNQIIRYAEVLLNVAEAYARQGNTAAALAALNQVRNRAVTTAARQYTAANFADANALIRAILNERRIEFAGEGRRWADIHRLARDPQFSTGGIPAKVRFANTTFASWGFGRGYSAEGVYSGTTLSQPAIPYDDFRFLWPIPQTELNTNPTLAAQQNPGY
jgi:hypothetical protein